jgi:hypothetical protein
MSFPVSPTNGSTTTVNGITYIYRASTQSWIRTQTPFGDFNVSGNLTAGNIITTNGLYWSNGAAFVSGSGGGGGTLTASSTPPSTPDVADQWYNTTTDVLYEYINDGTNTYWIDVQSPIFNSYLYTNHTGNLNISGNLSVTSAAIITGNLTTVANLNVSRTANILGNLIIAGNGAFARNVTVSSNLTVTGNVRGGNITATNTLAAGNITVTSNIATGNITVTSNITAGNINVTRGITSASITSGNITITSNITTSNITATTSITSARLTSSNITAGNINTSSTLAVVGNVEFSTANVNLGDANNLIITGGIDGNFLKSYGNGSVSWQPLPLTNIQEFIATGGQTVFTIIGIYTVGTVLVFVNGIQLNSADYTATSGTTVVLSDPRIAGDIVRIVSSVGGSTLSSGLVLNVTETKNFAVAMSVAMGM